ncbi:YbhB/YbcL family Raf kinase inhibitor-like protein [Nocardia veterana]|uniref:YbhB/YbcL family Raf kinase inhibitor-like protein n=1 Tax=Nocardia veterana TaxID=132249 RepID=A0A7X6RKH5_9NOCA|nr:YbhB/YbcL family Raf kinase inhibitor-like protein [Nocardia veterana]NKY89347.1 YbhB/YbcL family Raf kinase inhibitor-like protein [Nocardia veterana]
MTNLLHRFRAGTGKLAWNHPGVANAPETIIVSSPAFADGGPIPDRHAGPGVGDNVSPPLNWDNIPSGTRELVLLVEDPDAPLPRPFVHCVVTDIGPETSGVEAGALSRPADRAQVSFTVGKASIGKSGYLGPAPIRGHGPHRYIFQLFALDETVDPARRRVTKRRVLEAIRGHVIARGRLTGTYERV